MRHIGTLIAAILIAPMAWILLAFGQERSVAAFANAPVYGRDFVHPLELLAGAGLLLGLLATLRVSPIGSALTGAVYVLSYVAVLVSPQGALGLFGHGVSIGGHHVDTATPVRTGTSFVLGALMLVAVVSVGRWRRWPRADRDVFDDDAADRPVGVDGLDLAPPARPLAAARSLPPPRFPEPEPEPEYADWNGSGFRPRPRVAGLRSPWDSRREDSVRW
jgi:hypothetical protein